MWVFPHTLFFLFSLFFCSCHSPLFCLVVNGSVPVRIVELLAYRVLLRWNFPLEFLVFPFGDFLWPLMVTRGEEYRPLPVAMQQFFSQDPKVWGDIMAFAALVERTTDISLSISGDSAYIATEKGECEISWLVLKES